MYIRDKANSKKTISKTAEQIRKFKKRLQDKEVHKHDNFLNLNFETPWYYEEDE